MEILAQPQENLNAQLSGLQPAPAAARIERSVAQKGQQEITSEKGEVVPQGGADACPAQEVTSPTVDDIVEGSQEGEAEVEGQQVVIPSGTGNTMMNFAPTNNNLTDGGVDVEFEFGQDMEWDGDCSTMQQILDALGVASGQQQQIQQQSAQQLGFQGLQDIGLWNGVGVF
jgi:hypothetical protein